MILQWVRNRIWNKRRLIFRYHDGRRVRSADPIVLAAGLHGHPEYLYRHLRDAAEGDQESIDIVARAACDVFGVSPLEGSGQGGLTVAERIELMMAFDLYLFELKKNIAVSPTSPVSTEPTSPPSPAQTTSDTSDSGSTADEPSSEPPTSTGPAI
ncbi:MAG: hypothetical protein ACF788_01375 [Novipirellula sp. JB048]